MLPGLDQGILGGGGVPPMLAGNIFAPSKWYAIPLLEVLVNFSPLVVWTCFRFYLFIFLIGGKRKLMIPPLLAYGPEPAGCFSGKKILLVYCMQKQKFAGISLNSV